MLSFLGTHAFPLGLVSCADGLSIDAHNKTLYLARLIKEVRDGRAYFPLGGKVCGRSIAGAGEHKEKG